MSLQVSKDFVFLLDLCDIRLDPGGKVPSWVQHDGFPVDQGKVGRSSPPRYEFGLGG